MHVTHHVGPLSRHLIDRLQLKSVSGKIFSVLQLFTNWCVILKGYSRPFEVEFCGEVVIS